MNGTSPNGTWQSWFEHCGRRLLLYARQWGETSADAEDIVQEAFVRFWRSPWRKDAEAEVQLFTMVRRAGLDLVRRRARRVRREEKACLGEEAVAWFVPPEGDEARHAALQEALARLPDEQREVVVLKVWAGLTFEQIGRTLEISPNTAASRYRYGLAALRRELNPVLP